MLRSSRAIELEVARLSYFITTRRTVCVLLGSYVLLLHCLLEQQRLLRIWPPGGGMVKMDVWTHWQSSFTRTWLSPAPWCKHAQTFVNRSYYYYYSPHYSNRRNLEYIVKGNGYLFQKFLVENYNFHSRLKISKHFPNTAPVTLSKCRQVFGCAVEFPSIYPKVVKIA